MHNSVSALGARPKLLIVGRKQGTGLTEQQARHLAEQLRPFHVRFEENGTAMAKAWGISQSQMAQLLTGRGRGAGVAVLCRLRMHTGLAIDELLGLPRLGPSLDDKIRTALHDELGKLEEEGKVVRLQKRPKSHTEA